MTTTSDLGGRTAIVTGGASGMGAASAAELAAHGARVVLLDIDPQGLETVAGQIGAAATHVGDVGDPAFCDQVVADTIAEFGSVDIGVHAAGTIVRADGVDTTDDQWARIFRTNVDGVFNMCRAELQEMRARQTGAIVNFGSIWGEVGAAGHTAYAATKGAVHLMTKSLALEHARDGIRVNAVCPGEIRTPMLSSERAAPPTEAELSDLADRAVPMGRLGDPADVARVVAFLVSDAAAYMTGAMVTVDGGYTAR